MTEEVWKDIPGRPGYLASSLGRIKSLDSIMWHGGTLRGRIRKTPLNPKGYPQIAFRRDEPVQRVHRIIAMTFLGTPPDGAQVNHKNGIKTDNRVENLEWCTGSENQRHSAAIIGRSNGRLNPESVKLIRQLKATTELTNIEIAEKVGASPTSISYVISGKQWYHV